MQFLKSLWIKLLSIGIVLVALAVVGIGCGGGSSDSEKGTASIIKEGTFFDSVVEGMEFRTDTQSGVTDTNGTFTYSEGETVTFFIGDVVLGEAMAKPTMTPIDLVDEAVDETHPTVVNICRFLQSLDVDGNIDDYINISAEIRDALKGEPPIDFNQTIENFTNDPGVQALFDTLNALNVFDTGDRELCDAPQATDHLRRSLHRWDNIIVRSPNGRELLVAGGSFQITWNASSSIENVTILLSQDSGGNYTTPIVLSTPNDGSYTWELIPSNLAGSDNRIRILNTDNTSCYDNSNRDFTILEEMQSSIAVFTPNGGEEWIAGTSREIIWNAIPTIANVKIELSLDAGQTFTHEIADSTDNDSVYIWDSIPVTAVGNFNRIRISNATDDMIYAQSASSFTIKSPTIHIESPDGGEQWEAGANGEIIWEASLTIEDVKILLSEDGGQNYTTVIVDSTPNDGRYVWTSIAADEGSSYRIRIEDAVTAIYDDSDSNFSVYTAGSAPIEGHSIQVISPNGGETLQAGSSYEINWVASDSIANVKIELSTDAGANYSEIVPNETNDGAYIWHVDAQQSSSNFCRIRISDVSDPSVFDISDMSFTIAAPGESPIYGPSIQVISPNGGEVWAAGMSEEITWQASASIQVVKIELTYFAQGETKVHLINPDTPNSGSYNWGPIPLDAVGKFCRVRISDADPNSSISDESDASFTINEGPMIQVESPNGGEIWERGTDREITWKASSSIQNVKIGLSKDGGQTWDVTLANSTAANTGSYLWTEIPNDAAGNSNRIRIEDAANSNVYDESDQDFTIQKECVTLGCVLNRILESSSDDSDNDSLPDDVEAMLGSDPNDHDSDHDGVFDFTELFQEWNLDDYAPIPDLDNDGIYAINDPYDVEQAQKDGELVDTDGDGIADYLEYYGYIYNWMTGEYLAWDGDIGLSYYKSDPFRASTDQDPYPDGVEVSGVDMDVTVEHPGDLPMVPAYPNIVVKLEGYQVTLNEDLVITEGKSLSKGTSWNTQTEETFSHYDQINYGGSVTVTAGFSGWSFEGSVSATAYYGKEEANTNTFSTVKSKGGERVEQDEWSAARSMNPTDAARVKLFLKIYNHGTAAASNIIPTLTLKIGGFSIATFEPGNAQVNLLGPGDVYPSTPNVYWVVDSIDTGAGVVPISLTMDELRALETGAPVSVHMTQMLADVMARNEDGQWERISDWNEYVTRCRAVSSNLFMDVGDGNIIHYLVYSDDSAWAPRVTLGDALMWVADGFADPDTNELKISYYDRKSGMRKETSLDGWIFALDPATLDANGIPWQEDAEGNIVYQIPVDYNLFDTVLTPDSNIRAEAPAELLESRPQIHYAYMDNVNNVVRALVTDYYGITEVEFRSGDPNDPSSLIITMREEFEGSGFYVATIPPDYEWQGTENITATNVKGYSSPETPDPSINPFGFQVVQLYAGPLDVIVKPEIRWVKLDHNELLLTAEIEARAEIPIKEVYLVLHESQEDDIPMEPVAGRTSIYSCRLPDGYHTPDYKELVIAVNQRGFAASSAVTDRVNVRNAGYAELKYHRKEQYNHTWSNPWSEGFDLDTVAATTDLADAEWRIDSQFGPYAPYQRPYSVPTCSPWPNGGFARAPHPSSHVSSDITWSPSAATVGSNVNQADWGGFTRSDLALIKPIMYQLPVSTVEIGSSFVGYHESYFLKATIEDITHTYTTVGEGWYANCFDHYYHVHTVTVKVKYVVFERDPNES